MTESALIKDALDVLRVAASDCTSGDITEEQKATLAKWPGWGPLAPAFDYNPSGQWARAHETITELCDERTVRAAQENVDNSFSTPEWVAELMWGLLTDAGYTGGSVIEPGCGAGVFMRTAPSGTFPDLFGVDLDPLAARVSSLLCPEATVVCAELRDVALPRADVAVGNVPFAASRVYDTTYSYNSSATASLHAYFLRRAVDALRPGGYLVMIGSRHLIDNGTIADLFAGDSRPVAQFVGAVRLPGGVFPGTNVVADIIVARAPLPDETVKNVSYERYRLPGSDVAVSTYWQEHPEHIAGEMSAGSHFMAAVDVTSADHAADVADAVQSLSARARQTPMSGGYGNIEPNPALDQLASADAPEGSFRTDGATVEQVRGGVWETVRAGAELCALIALKERVLALLAAEADDMVAVSHLEQLRVAALAAYTGYTGTYGPLNRGTLHEGAADPETDIPSLSWRRPRLGGFRRDPDYLTVMAVEVFDQDTATAEPAPVLLRRINHPAVPVERVDTVSEAVAVSMGETGRIDVSRVAGLLGVSAVSADQQLMGIAFRDPGKAGQWVRSDDYLSGNIHTRLKLARRAAGEDPTYRRNVAALESVMPMPLGPNDILMRLGSPVIAEEDIKAFLREELGASATSVDHEPTTNTWEVSAGGVAPSMRAKYGTSDFHPDKLVELALNGKSPIAYDEVWRNGRTVRVKNPDRSLAAQSRLDTLNDRFSVWVWEDKQRCDRLCVDYNRRFNSIVSRRVDGSWVQFPGMSTAFTPHQWQRNMVDRIIAGSAALCGHCVGAGKTATMAMAAVALRRYGLARKPMIVVPNHLLEQIAREMQQVFPTGKFLIAGKEDLSKSNRRLFMARCATGDWDAVVVTHSGFNLIPVLPGTETAWLEEQVATFEDAKRSCKSWSGTAKAVARAIRSYRTKIEKLMDNHADGNTVYFEHLGVDYLAIDEAHAYKRLDVGSRAEGFSLGASKRASDLFMKAQWIKDRKCGKPHLGLFTGTPWTNTLAETYVWQRFLQPEALAEAGVSHFDAWAAVFVRRATVVQVTPDGSGFRTVTKPVRMMNIPDLAVMLNQVADILTADQIGLERPERNVLSLSVPMSPMQRSYVAGLVKRAEKLHSGSSSTAKGSDNMLAVCGDGRRAALDPLLVGVDEDSPKLGLVAEHVHRIWLESKDIQYGESPVRGALQMVFCDQGTPNKAKGPQTYGRLREQLVRRGMPAASIRFVHEATDDRSRAALFAACRDGSVSVLVGSSEKMATGTNVQARLSAVHHLDAPWRPSDIEQRNGRALRPGNGNRAVTIARYVTERSFDAFMWDTLEAKAMGFNVMYRPDPEVREVEDIGEVAPSYTQMKAMAAGNPLLVEQAEMAAMVRKLRTVKAVHRQGTAAEGRRLPALRDELESLPARVQALGALCEVVASWGDVGKTVRGAVARAGMFTYSVDLSDDVALNLYTARVTVEGITVIKGGEKVQRLIRSLSKGGKSAERCIDWLVDELRQAPDEHERLRARVRGLGDEVADIEAMVAQYEFPQQAELDAAETRLAAINAQITDLAKEAPSPVAA